MNTICINNETRPLQEADADWISRQVNGRRADGLAVCVRISIQAAPVQITLATAGCASGGAGGGRPPNNSEREFLQLWERHRLDQADFPVGQLIAFVKQVSRLL